VESGLWDFLLLRASASSASGRIRISFASQIAQL
jgi:hypothetical protein